MTQPQQSDPNTLSRRQLILAAAGFIAFITVLTLGINAIGVERLQQAIRDAGIFAPLVYIVIKMLTYVVAPLTSGPIQVVAGTLFDSLFLGTLYTLIGEVLGGSISFWIARRFGRPVVGRLVGEGGLARIDGLYARQIGSLRALFVMRVLLFSLWDFLSYAAGLAQTVKFRDYFWASVVGGAIPTFFFVWIGNTAILEPASLIVIYALVALLIVLPLVFRQQITRLIDGVAGANDES